MMTGKQVAEKAKSLLQIGTIPYVLGGETVKGMDCQGLVEWVLRELGMKASYKGTNDMWRCMGSDKGTITEGVAKFGEIPLGALIFIVDHDGGEPEEYQDDEGNAWHVYLKVDEKTLIHASKSNGMVTTRSFANKAINGGPSHYMLISGVDYGVENHVENDEDNAVENTANPMWRPLYSDMVFKLECVGNGTREIQTGLSLCGFELAIDGEFGMKTHAAVISFQERMGLVMDGIVGKNTWAALIKAVNAKTTKEG